MQKTLITLLLFISLGAKGDYWTQKANFGGAARQGAVAFSIGTKGYLGTGGYTNSLGYNDFWEYDQPTNSWTQKANFGGAARQSAVGFAIGTKGYIGTGYHGVSENDFWEYDQPTNTWTQKGNFPGVARYAAVAFSIGAKGYLGTGYGTTYLRDFWEYDPPTDTWTQKMNFGIASTAIATGFSDGTYGYIGTGCDSSTWPSGKISFWQWDPVTNVWTQKANFGGVIRSEACAFWLCPFGIIGGGTSHIPTGTVADYWKYHAASNTWSLIAPLGPGLREEAVGFTIGNKGYVATGFINDNNTSLKNDLWEYTPDSACTTGIQEPATTNFDFQIAPNPCKDFLSVSLTPYPSGRAGVGLSVTDATGKTIFTTRITTSPDASGLKLQTSNFAKGMYTVRVDDGKQSAVKKFVKE